MTVLKRSGYGIHCDIVNPKLLELQAAKEILAELCDIQIWEVDDLIKQHIVDFQLAFHSPQNRRM
jgi:hypothetical protein